MEYSYGLNYIGEVFGMSIVVGLFVYTSEWRFLLISLSIILAWWLITLPVRVLAPLRSYLIAKRCSDEHRAVISGAADATVTSVEADDVVEVLHDEGSFFLFAVDVSRTFWLDTLAMSPGAAPRNWPTRKFEIFRIPGLESEFGPVPTGKRLRRSATYELRDLCLDDSFEIPDDGVFDQPLGSLLDELGARR